MGFAKKIGESRLIKTIKTVLSSQYLPFFTAALVLICHYTGGDMVTFYYVAIVGIACVLLLEDATPVVGVFLFMQCMISYAHSPSKTVFSSDYFFQPAVLGQLVVLIAAFALSICYRIIVGIRKGRVRATPVFWGLCVLAVVFLLNGAFVDGYNPMNLFYGFSLAFLFLGIYVYVAAYIRADRETFSRLAMAFFALSIMLVFELAAVYLFNYKAIFADGKIHRNILVFGWGIWNTMGFMLTLCVPFLMYLAATKKHGYLFTLWAIVVAVSAVLTFSRQSILAVAAVFVISLIVLLVKGGYRRVNLAMIAVFLLASVVIAVIYKDKLISLFRSLIENLTVQGEFRGNGRKRLFLQAIENWKQYPIFGIGFYVELAAAAEYVGLPVIPDMYHNTLAQMLGACGTVGLLAYVAHRIQTLISFFRRPTTERTLLAASLLGFLICGLLDNHLFYLFPTIVYSCLLAFLVNSEKAVSLGENSEDKLWSHQMKKKKKNIKEEQNAEAAASTGAAVACVTEEAAEEIAVADAAVVVGVNPPISAEEEVVSYRKKGFRYGVYCFVKRAFDILSSGLALILLSWLILIFLLVKWLEDFHNPVYVSRRVGKDGKEFKILKIRTMVPNAEEMKQQLIDAGLNEADPPAFKMKNDPRITKVGKFYRKFSIDELLQLWNIFNGSMSVVGPRSPLPSEVAEYTEHQKHRLDVKGGLLCLWQIQHNRNEISFDEWVRLDVEYIQKQSVWLDLKIIFKGAWMVLFDHSGE